MKEITIGTTVRQLTEEEQAAIDAKGGEAHMVDYLNQYVDWLVQEAREAEKRAKLSQLAGYTAAELTKAVDTIEADKAAITEGDLEAKP